MSELETLLRIVFALGTLFLAGWGAVKLIARGEWIGHWPERVALAWLLGAGYASLGLFIFGSLFSETSLLAIIFAGAAGLFLAGRRFPAGSPPGGSAPWQLVEWFLFALLAGEAIIIAWFSATLILGWDGLALWDLKAQIAFANGGTLPAEYFQDASRIDSHVRYPLGWPYLSTWLYLCLDRVDQAWVRIFGAIYEFATFALLAGATFRLGGQRWAGLVVAACLFFLPALTSTPFGFYAGYADLPMAALFLAAVTRLPAWSPQPSPADTRLLSVLGLLLVWTKSEGTVLLAALAVVVFLARSSESWLQRGRAVLFLVAPAATLLAAFSLYLRSVGAMPEDNYLPATDPQLWSRLDRVGPILAHFSARLSDWHMWSLLWPGVLLALIALSLRGESRRAGLLALLLLLPLPGYVLAYLLSTWPDYLRHMATSSTRLLLQLAPVALLTIGLAIPARPKT